VYSYITHFIYETEREQIDKIPNNVKELYIYILKRQQHSISCKNKFISLVNLSFDQCQYQQIYSDTGKYWSV